MTKKKKDERGDILERLRTLARNLWWSWNPAAQEIFAELSPLTWEVSNHNPVAVLNQFSEAELRARLNDRDFLSRVVPVLASFERYMNQKTSAAQKRLRLKEIGTVAYFCAEFGVHESLPIYSGGLGVLAGDHAKSASDLGIPYVGIGLFYRQGYFKQHVNSAGMQEESYPHTHPAHVPLELVKDPAGEPLICSVEIGSDKVYFQSWRMNVGRARLYLLDTDVPQNDQILRQLTAHVYGGDVATRIKQEIVLGIGGLRFLRMLGVRPSVFHMNEGHAAFLTFELMREYVLQGKSTEEAAELARNQCVFTTHTPVPAGHDRFSRDLIEFMLSPMIRALNISMDDFMRYGQPPGEVHDGHFTMTILALKLSRAANGVSKKHGEVSRGMWKHVFSTEDKSKVPIGHITNGVHMPSWTSRTSWEFWERHNSHKWKELLNDAAFWKHVSKPTVVTDEELWAMRYELRRELVEFLRRKASDHAVHGGTAAGESILHLFSPDVLTIGFARRFAPYKRAPLIFRDVDRAARIFNDAARPVQMVFAGKAHPRDGEGKDFLRRIVEFTRHPQFFGKVVLVENYNMDVARHLVSGCDLWLNTPRRPLEASGTSGQKVAINGGLNASVPDGWWIEAYNGKNGWAIGAGEENLSPDEQDRRDGESLYELLEKEIIPLFYDRDAKGIPRKWISRIRNSMRTIIPTYNTHRMVSEYAKRYYYR